MKKIFSTLGIIGVLASGTFAVQASDTTEWRLDKRSSLFDYQNPGWAVSDNSYGDAYFRGSDTGNTLTVTGWTDRGSHGVHQVRERYDDHGRLKSGLGTWSGNGLGVLNGKNDSHTVDNGGSSDFLFFDFKDAVTITNIDINYVSSNKGSDISVAAFSSIARGLDVSSWGSILDSSRTAGTLLYSGNVEDVKNNASATDFSSHVREARYWLIGAYNSVFGGNSLTAGDDSFKLLAVTTESRPHVDVPTPATVLLLLAGLGLIARRRRA